MFEAIHGAGAPLHHLWRGSEVMPGRAFTGFNLIANQRQRSDMSWANALNALRDCRDATAVRTAVQLVRTRCYRPLGPVEREPFRDATHIFPLTARFDEHNAARLMDLIAAGAPSASIASLHTHVRADGTVSTDVPREWLPDERNRDDAGGLPMILRLAVGAKVMLRQNLDTADGLVNGAVGTITRFEYADGSVVEAGGQAPAGDPRPAVVALWIQFDNARVGRRARAVQAAGEGTARVLAADREAAGGAAAGGAAAGGAAAGGQAPPAGPIRIAPVTAMFRDRQMRMLTRTNFPVMLAWAVTVHRTQGLCMDRAVVSMEDMFEVGMAYVALSRVRTLDGLAVRMFDEPSMQMVSPAVRAEYRRLDLYRGATEVLAARGAGPQPSSSLARSSGPDLSAENLQAASHFSRPQDGSQPLSQPQPQPALVNPRNWYGHDLTVWPPTNLLRANGDPVTLSWAYMPVIWSAVGQPQLLPIPWPLVLRKQVSMVVDSLSRALRAEGITYQALTAEQDGPGHLPAARQEELLALMDPDGDGPSAWLTQTATDIAKNPFQYSTGDGAYCHNCRGIRATEVTWVAEGPDAHRAATVCSACGACAPMGMAPWLYPAVGSALRDPAQRASGDDNNPDAAALQSPEGDARPGEQTSAPEVPLDGPLAAAASVPCTPGECEGEDDGGAGNAADEDALGHQIESILLSRARPRRPAARARAPLATPRTGAAAQQPAPLTAATPETETPVRPMRLDDMFGQ